MYIRNKMIFLISMGVSIVATVLGWLTMVGVLPFKDTKAMDSWTIAFFIVGVISAIVCGEIQVLLQWLKNSLTRKSSVQGATFWTMFYMFFIHLAIKAVSIALLIIMAFVLPAVFAVAGYFEFGKDL